MSYTKQVKKELTTLPIDTREMLVEFAVFLYLAGEYHIEDKVKMIDFKTNSLSLAQRFLKLARSLYQAKTALLSKQNNHFAKKQMIIIRITSEVEKILNEHDYLGDPFEAIKLIMNDETYYKTALRSAFLISGSVNDPKKAEYHLEMSFEASNIALFMQQLMNFYDLNAKIIRRRQKLVVYVKEAEAIRDFLQLIGAQNAVFKFEDIRIKRDFNNSINRIINCEIANENKTAMAAYEQLNDIQMIQSSPLTYQALPDKLKQIISLRLDYQEANLRELVMHYQEKYGEKISRSGLNHRLEKIKQIAKQIQERRDE